MDNENVKAKKLPLNWILAVFVVIAFAINNLIDFFALSIVCGYVNMGIYSLCIIAAVISLIYLIKKFKLLNFIPLLLSISPVAFALIVVFLYAKSMSGF